MPKPTVENLDRGQLDLMWSFLKFGNGKPNIAVLKENLDDLRQMMIQKSAGQEPYKQSHEIPFKNFETIINNVAIEAMQLYLGGGLDALENIMNNEYIKRKAVNDILNELGGCDASDDFSEGWDKAIDAAIEAVEKLPAANIAPTRHGEWKENNGIFECSNCGYCFEHEGYKPFFHFCPNCGAKMDIDK